MKVLDLFSGLGGFSLGLERAGMQTVAFCERDEFCRAVLAKHWPDVPCHEDITTLSPEGITADLICGGYPCQPFSQAGRRSGSKDPRHLWPEMHRIIASVRPPWVLAENVTGHIFMGLDQVLTDLENLGYASRPLIIPACGVDAPHRRDRVWIIARHAPIEGSLPSAHSGVHRGEKGARARHAKPERRGWWDSESGVLRVADGVPRRVERLRAIGNSLVPQIAEIIGKAIMSSALNSNPRP